MSFSAPFLRTLSITTAILGFAVSCPAEETSPTPDALKLELDIMRAELRKPLAELQEKYDEALEQLEKAEQEKGNLKTLMEVRDERSAFRNRVEEPASATTLPRLNELRAIYERESTKADSAIIPQEAMLYADYLSQLEEISKALTQQGKIDEALKVSTIADEARGELAAFKSGEISAEQTDTISEVVILGEGGEYEAHEKCEISQVEDKFLIHTNSGNAPLQSRESFRPPFQIQARAETDGSLRFYFGKSGIVIFNWDVNAKTMRLGDPGTPLGEQDAFDEQGDLKLGRTYDFELLVKPESITVKVDGRKRGELKGDFSSTAAGPVGIGASMGSTVLVDYFKVVRE